MAHHVRERWWLDGDLGFSDDPLREALYALSEWAITVIGPIFWICLVCLFLIVRFGV
jgi:hypothetical protein